MKETTTRPDTPKEVYEAPKCEIIEIENEGVLCGSGYDAGHDGFGDGGSVGW